MVNYKINVNPNQKTVSFEIKGSFEELESINLNKIKELHTKVNNISKELGFNVSKSPKIESDSKDDEKDDEELETKIKIPEHLMSKVESLDERKKFPILWYFSSNPIMTVDEFLTQCVQKGFSLKPWWLPTAGGKFSKTFVQEDKILHKVGKRGSKTTWTFTDIGKLKIMKMIKELEDS